MFTMRVVIAVFCKIKKCYRKPSKLFVYSECSYSSTSVL